MRKIVPRLDRQTAIDYNAQINIVSERNFPDEALLEPKHARYRRHFPNVALNIRGWYSDSHRPAAKRKRRGMVDDSTNKTITRV
jgi:hypothetical protein